MVTGLQKLFFDAVQNSFSVLLNNRFKGPSLEIKHRIGQTRVVYLGENLALELILDEHDKDISCFVAKIINGQPASVWKYDDKGRLVRDHLTALLRRQVGEQALSLFTRVTGMELEDRIPITVGDYARMMQVYGQHIINDDPSLFG